MFFRPVYNKRYHDWRVIKIIKEILVKLGLIFVFLLGVLLIKNSTGGFYGNDYDLIGFPICVGASLSIIIVCNISLDKVLDGNGNMNKNSTALLMYAAVNNALMCALVCIGMLYSIDGNVFAVAILYLTVILSYNTRIIDKRKDLKKCMIYLSALVFLLSLGVYLKLYTIDFIR